MNVTKHHFVERRVMSLWSGGIVLLVINIFTDSTWRKNS